MIIILEDKDTFKGMTMRGRQVGGGGGGRGGGGAVRQPFISRGLRLYLTSSAAFNAERWSEDVLHSCG